ncbi:hypothetical protein BCV70DRAFT_204782 [Testicularia cyperi]|uniref:Uncharacterized protein n=1 Tax=Testicularia cyperi TaxID=1882483 RepID=A0A317XUV8_9BASI|nr:hypothetical protein BCV70DRAFT_204782 [Testicularia cyperi]
MKPIVQILFIAALSSLAGTGVQADLQPVRTGLVKMARRTDTPCTLTKTSIYGWEITTPCPSGLKCCVPETSPDAGQVGDAKDGICALSPPETQDWSMYVCYTPHNQ